MRALALRGTPGSNRGEPLTFPPQLWKKVSRALALREQEEHYIFLLASAQEPNADTIQQAIPTALEKILESLTESPAYVLNQSWDVLAANAASDELFGKFEGRADEGQNVIWRLFHDPGWRGLYLYWAHYARCSVAHFRSDVTARPTPRSTAVIGGLMRTSPLFREWWESHEVLTPEPSRKSFYLDGKGQLQFDLTVLQVQQASHLKLFVYSPVTA